MLVDGYEGGDEVLGWDFAERDFRTKDASATNAMYLSIVPGNERRVYQSRSTYNSLSGARVVLCGDDDKSSRTEWEASLSASKDTSGNQQAQIEVSIQKTTESNISYEVSGSAGVSQDRNGNVQGKTEVRVTLKG